MFRFKKLQANARAMPILLATVRNGQDQDVARIEADRGSDDLEIRNIVCEEQWRHTMEELSGPLTLMINGALGVTATDDGSKEIHDLERVLAERSRGELRLAYVPEGIEAAHQLRRQIARKQAFSVPFSELQDILHRSLSR
jgi:hypothetical protein